MIYDTASFLVKFQRQRDMYGTQLLRIYPFSDKIEMYSDYLLAFFSSLTLMKKKHMPTNVVRMPINRGHSVVLIPFGLTVIVSESTGLIPGLK